MKDFEGDCCDVDMFVLKRLFFCFLLGGLFFLFVCLGFLCYFCVVGGIIVCRCINIRKICLGMFKNGCL